MNNFAITSTGIGEALKRSASALFTANNSLDDSIGLIAGANTIVQDPEKVGTALKTLSLRLRGATVELQEAGLETDNMAESTSKLQEKLLALTGVDIMLDANTFKDPTQILREMADAWGTLTDVNRAAALELMGGKQQANVLAAILTNFNIVEDAIETSTNSANSALKENERWMQSIEGHIAQFTNALQTMWMNLISSDIVKSVVDTGTTFIKFLDSSIGRITALSVALALLGNRLKISPIIKVVDNEFQVFGKTIETIKNNFNQLSSQSSGILDKIKAGFSAIFTNPTKSIDLSNILSKDDFDTELNKIINGFNSLDQSVNSITWDNYIDGISQSDKAMGAALKTCTQQNGQIVLGEAAYQAYSGAATSAAIGTSTVGNAARFTTIKLVAMKVAALAANAALTMGLSALITLAFEGIGAWANASKNAAEAAKNAASVSQEIKKQNESLEDYKIKIEELRKSLESESLTEEEVYNKREELLQIQEDLIKNYDIEKDNINLVTGALKDQMAVIDELSKKKSQQWLNNNQKSINEAIEFFDNPESGSLLDSNIESKKTAITNWGSSRNISEMIDEYTQGRDNMNTKYLGELYQDIYFSGAVDDVKAEVEEFQKWLGDKEDELNKQKTDLLSAPDQNDSVRLQIKALEKDIEQLQHVREDLGTEYTNWFGEDSTYATNKALLEETQYNTAITKYEKEYGNILQAQKDLAKAQAKGDDEGIKVALSTINAQADAAAKVAESKGQNYMVNYFNGIKDEYATLTKEIEFEFDLTDNITFSDTGKKMKDTLSEALSTVNGQNEKQILQLYETNPEDSALSGLIAIANEYDMSLEELCGTLVKLKYIQSGFDNKVEQITATTTSLDILISSVEGYKAALETIGNITSDGQAISEDYYNTLKEQLGDITVGEQDLSDAIDTTNGYVVKNASLLNKLVNQSRKAQKATIQVAKAQAQTQYKELVKQIRSSIIYLGAAAQANGFVTQATFDNIDAMQKQLASLKQTIQQYALLELSLSDAANAFDEYEKAKERDAQLTYDDSMLEMLKTIDEGILKNETGTEAFEYAVRAIVPEQFWKDIDDVDEKIRSIHDYIDGDNVFSRFFYVDEESGELDITTDNVREFVDLCINSGLFDGSSKDFALSNSVEGVEDFAEALGVTEPVILAMLTALEKVDAKWGNILTDVTTKPLDREINKAVDEVDTSTQKIEDFWKAAIASGKFDNAEYQKLINELDTANKKLQEAEQKAQENARQYNLCQTAISAYRGELKLTQEQADSLARSLGFIDENGNPTISVNNDGTLNLTDEQLSTLLQKLGLLEEPSIIQIQLRYDNIVAQIDELQKYIDGKINDPNDSEILKSLKITNVEEAKAKVDELIPEKDQIELTYNITETSSEEQKSVLESYQELAKNGMEFTVTADVTDANEKIDELNNNNPKDKEVVFTADGSTASDVIAGIARQLAALPDDVSITIETKEKKTIFETVVKAITGGSKETSTDTTLNSPKRYRGLTMALGNAHATGSVGLKTSESDAVVGELGREMIVDPVKGVYYTVGDNGTEMVDLPKGAIIYNHKQTEELLKNGHTSRGKLTGGLSFAHGNAHGSYGVPSYHPNLEDSTSLKNHTNVNTKWDDATSTLLDAADSLAESSSNLDDASEAFEDAINWIDVLFTRIENNISEQEAYLETLIDTSGIKSVKDVFYGGITDQLRNRAYYSLEAANYYRDKANVEMAGLPAEIQNRIKSGAINIQDFKFEKSTEGLTDEQKKVVEKEREAFEEYVAQINQAIEYYDKISEYEQQYYTTITEIADKAVEHQEDVAQGFENEIGLVEHLNNTLEAHNDLQEAKEGFATEAYYDAQIDANETMLAQYKAERKALQDVLDEEVRLGHVKVGSQQWFDMQQAIYDVDDAIIDTEASIEDLQNYINDLKWDKFDELINRYDYIGDEISNVIQLLSHDPDGLIMEELRDLTSDNWATDSGLTTIGMYAQEMERAQYVANQYAEAIKDLEKDYASGKYKETEYLNKLNELISAQYENLENYHDAKDAIVELNKARVDAIKNGIQLEIEKYDDLIAKKKELLDREQDLHSFNNEIEEKEKDVADLRKQLAAMDGDTTQATTAKKKQLQEQLVEAQKSLEESYYSHSMTERQNALDKEFESFEEEKNKEIETWEKWLEDSNTVIDESLAYVQENTQTVYNTLSEMGSQYGLTLSTNITEPWTNGEFAISSYSDTFETAVSAFTQQLDNIALHWESVTTAAEEAARVQAEALQQEYKATTNQITTANKNPSSGSTIEPNRPTTTNKAPTTTNNTNTQKAISVGGKINAGSAKIYDYAGDTSGELQYYRNDPIYTVLQELNGYLLVRYHKLKSGYTGWFKKSDVKAYASGLSKAKDDHWAIINELGSELQLVPGKSGNLEYVKYGTSILPHDISSKLMDIALDPVSVFDDIKAGVKVPTIETKDFNYEFNFDSLLHVDNCNQDSIPALQKMIRTEFNSMMKQVNASLRRA